MVWKKVVNADVGDADHFGGNDIDKISDSFSGVDVDDFDINCDFKIRSGKLQQRNPANTFSYIHTPAAITADRTLTYPLLTGTDTLVTQDFAQTLKNKTMDDALNSIKLHSAFKYTIFIDTNDSNIIKCRDNDLGTIVSSHATDSKIPIQYAADNASGKPIFIRGGTYLLASGLDFKDKYVNIHGEKSNEGHDTRQMTLLRKNYTASAADIFIDAFGSDFFYVNLRHLWVDGDDEGIGIKFAHTIRQMEDVDVSDFRTGVYIENNVYTNIFNLLITSCIDYGIKIIGGDTLKFYGGRMSGNGTNVYMEDCETTVFFGTNFEHGNNYGVYIDNNVANSNTNAFYSCEFESAAAGFTNLLYDEGRGNTYYKCKFNSPNTDFTAIHFGAAARDNTIEQCQFKGNTSATTFRVTVDSGALRNRFLFNNVHTGGQIDTFTFLDNGTDTFSFGNAPLPSGVPSIPNRISIDTNTGMKIGTSTTQKIGFFNKTPIAQKAANADTSGASLAALETEVNELKQLLRDYGLMA